MTAQRNPKEKVGKPKRGSKAMASVKEHRDAAEEACRELLAKLTVRQRKLVEGYATHGRLREAARDAGYTGNDSTLASIACQTIKLPYVAAALEAMIESDPLVTGRLERLRIRSEIARDTKEASFARLAALDALDKIQGKLIDRLEISGPGGAALRMELENLSTADLARIAGEPDVVG